MKILGSKRSHKVHKMWCIINCPTDAWTRSKEKYYKLVILGRTGEKDPRPGQDFVTWVIPHFESMNMFVS